MLKILVVGKQNSLYWVENVVDTFQRRGDIVDGLYLNRLDVIDTLKKNLLKIISKNLVSKKLSVVLEKKILSFQPNLIIVISPFMFDNEVFECLDRFDNISKFAWIGDIFGVDSKNTAKRFDKLFFTDSAFLAKGKEFDFPNSEYLPLAVNTNRFFNKNLQRVKKLLFIASYTQQREEFLNQIDTIEVKLVGSKWDKNNLSSNINCINENISIDDVAEAYNKFKFILNIKHEHNVINGLNMRTFEAIACGGCLLQDYVSDVELNFEIDKDIVVYRNLDELNYLIDKLQKDKKFYNNITANGQKLLASKHTYNHRIKSMLECFKG